MKVDYTVSEKLLDREDFQHACQARDFGQMFRLMKQWDGVSQDRIAAPIVGMSQARISRIVRGEDRIATAQVIERVSDALHIPGAYLGLAPRQWETSSPRATTTSGATAPAIGFAKEPGWEESASTSGQVVDKSLEVRIDVDAQGQVRLHYIHELQNLSDEPFTRFSRQFWFKHTTGPLVIQPSPESDRNVLIQRLHDVGIQVKFACQIFPAIMPGETAKVGYWCTGGQFSSELYWRQTVYRPTEQLHLQLSLAGVDALTGCQAVEERLDGSEITATEGLSWNTDENGTVIDLNRRDLRTNQCVTLRWDVPRATA